MTPRLIVAGAASNVGKTTLTVGLLAALRRRGLDVRPFKAGPDYIDPSYHALAAGRPSRNLDGWMVPHDQLVGCFTQAVAGADLALVEGVMGLYDGFDYRGDAGSTAELAKLLRAPVVLVLDVRAQARSAAATALGFQRLDPAVPLAGFICNRVGSAGHYAGVKTAIEDATGLPVLGGVPRADALAIPERHLGLTPAGERGDLHSLVDGLADLVRENCDVDAILAIARAAPPLAGRVPVLPPATGGTRPVIAVAQDAAFSFYYEDNLDLLRRYGAELRPFSPLTDRSLPPGTGAVYIGGGFPEVYAAALAANAPLHGALRAAVAAGLPCYAECGGLMYLTTALVDPAGARHEMVGLLPGHAVMRGRRARLGYATVRALADTALLRAGEEARGHEFHYSTWEDVPDGTPRAYCVQPHRGEGARLEGFARGNLLASYVHLHFWSKPKLARRFTAAARRWTEHRGRREERGAIDG